MVWSITYAERCESLGEEHVVIVRTPWRLGEQPVDGDAGGLF